MASPRDLRDWIALLEREGELVRVDAEVDPHLEITEIVDRTVKAGGPALLFTKVKGSELPLLINQFGTERRMVLAFGVERLDDVGQKLADVLEMQPPEGLRDKVAGLMKLKEIAGPKVQVRALSHESSAPSSPLRADLMQVSERLTNEMWPGVPVIPTMGVSSTDSRTLRAAGIPMYGISGLFVDPDDTGVHGLNEHIGVKQLYDGREFMYRLIKALAGGS